MKRPCYIANKLHCHFNRSMGLTPHGKTYPFYMRSSRGVLYTLLMNNNGGPEDEIPDRKVNEWVDDILYYDRKKRGSHDISSREVRWQLNRLRKGGLAESGNEVEHAPMDVHFFNIAVQKKLLSIAQFREGAKYMDERQKQQREQNKLAKKRLGQSPA